MRPDVELLPPSVRARLREGSYTTTQNGKPVTVSVTDGDTLKDAADLWAVIKGEYQGTKSAASEGIKEIVGTLQSGAPLSDAQWATFHRLKDKYAQQLVDFRAGPDNDIEGFVPLPPTGAGRIQEAAFALDGQLRRLMEQYDTPSTTAKDKAITAPHLLDSVLHDLAHTRQHIARIMAPDVKGDAQSVAFNAEHALHHAESAQEHASKLDKHLGQAKTDPKTWTAEREAINSMREAVAQAKILHAITWARVQEADGRQQLDGIFSKADGSYGDMWVHHGDKKANISFGDWEGDLASQAHAATKKALPGYSIDSETEQGDPGKSASGWQQVYAGGKRVGKLSEGRATPPPNLRPAAPHDEATENQQATPVHECGTCKMYDQGLCWGYGLLPVDDDWVCDSWAADPNWKQQNAMSDALTSYPLPLAEAEIRRLREYSDAEARDDKGEWTGGGGADPLTGPRWVPTGTRIQMPGQTFGSKVVGRSADGYLVRHEPGLPGTGPLSRVHDESAVVVHGAALDSGYRPGREAQPREDSGKYMGGARSYDPLLLHADSLHAAEAARRLIAEGRVRVAGQGDSAQAAATDLARRVGDRATVRTQAVKGNPYTLLTAVREAKPAIATETVAADPDHPDTHKPTIAVDFDGVLHAGGHGMPGEVEGQPVDGAQAGLKALSLRYRVVVFTARQDFAAVRRWLKAHGMDQYVEQVTNVKPNALAYIDDRAIHFAGDWKAAVAAADPAKATYQPIEVKKVYEAGLALERHGLARMAEYSDAEARDGHGRWSGGGDGEPLEAPVLRTQPGEPGIRAYDAEYARTGGPATHMATGAPAGTDSQGSALKVGDGVTTNSTGIVGTITKEPDSVFGRITIDSGYGSHAVDDPGFAHVVQASPSQVTKLTEALALLLPSLRRALGGE